MWGTGGVNQSRLRRPVGMIKIQPTIYEQVSYTNNVAGPRNLQTLILFKFNFITEPYQEQPFTSA